MHLSEAHTPADNSLLVFVYSLYSSTFQVKQNIITELNIFHFFRKLAVQSVMIYRVGVIATMVFCARHSSYLAAFRHKPGHELND